MSAHASAALANHLAVVPNLVWLYNADLDRWRGWITDSGINTVSLDFGSLRSGEDWCWALKGVEYLNAGFERMKEATPRLVVNGPSTVERIKSLVDTWSNTVTIASQKPWLLAKHGFRLLPGLGSEKASMSQSKNELVVANADVFETEVARLSGSEAEEGRDGHERTA
jgi:hypothetical protein